MEIRLDRESRHPIYLQLANKLREMIKDGIFKENEILPEERSLSAKLGINRLTLRKSLDILIAEGLIYKIWGRGIYVGREAGDSDQLRHLIGDYKFVGISTIEIPECYHLSAVIAAAIEYFFKKGHDSKRLYYYSPADELRHYKNNLEFLSGLIVAPAFSDSTARNIRFVRDKGIPVVIVSESNPELSDFDTVFSDDQAGAATAVNYFYQAGHRDIAFVSISPSFRPSTLRREGYIQAVQKLGLSPRLIELKKDKNTPYEGIAYHEISKLISRQNYPTAIMTENDAVAAGVYFALKKLNVSMPDQVELVGFGNDLEARRFFNFKSLPFSTVAVDRIGIGLKSAELLLERLRSPGAPIQKIFLPDKLIHQGTTRG